jgi:AraC family transcriptional regulator of arabinose operon
MPKRKVKDIRILTAVKLVNANFNQNFDFNSLAETLNLSPSRLRHLFKTETGTSFIKYLRLVRMRRAKHLLETSFLSVKETARRVGITDATHFVRDFEKEFGLSPDRYRKQFHAHKEPPSYSLKSEEKTEEKVR